MKIYEVLLKDGEVYSYILEIAITHETNGEKVAESKRYYLLDTKNNINDYLGRIASIGTLVEFFDSYNMSVREVVENDKINMIYAIINKKMNNNGKNSNYNNKTELSTPYSAFINEIVTNDLNDFFKDNKIVKEYVLNQKDYELLKQDINSNKKYNGQS